MTVNDLQVMTPLIILGATAVLALLAITIRRNHAATALISAAGLFASVWFMPLLEDGTHVVAPLLVMDPFARFFIALFSLSALAITLLAYGYLKVRNEQCEEFYVLLLVSTFGACVLVASRHFALFFLGLETMTVALYGMIGYFRTRPATEAGIKYLILAGAASAMLLFGIALVFAETGALGFAEINLRLMSDTAPSVLLAAGFALIIAGASFELALVPFHLWTADVYRGAAAPVTAYIATIGKGALLAAFIRLNVTLDIMHSPALLLVLAGLAVASMLIGNLLALLETNVKRILAYSSIAHLGYLIVAVLAQNALGVEAAMFYLVAYFATTLAAFGVVTVLSTAAAEPEDLDAWRGLYWRRPALAVLMTFCMLSLAGVPLTVGFIGKFYLLAAGVHAGLWVLVLILVLSSVIGLFYYLRIVVAMLKPIEEPADTLPASSYKGRFVLVVLGLIILVLGLAPVLLQPIVERNGALLMEAPVITEAE